MNLVLSTHCLVCNHSIQNQGHLECEKCLQVCEHFVENPELLEGKKDGDYLAGISIKSKCCSADIKMVGITGTCSDYCREIAILRAEEQQGVYFYETDSEGIIREIPTRDLFFNGGIKTSDIKNYPKAKLQQND